MEFKVVVEVEEYLVFWMRVVNIVVRHFEFIRWVGVKIGGIENRGFFGMKEYTKALITTRQVVQNCSFRSV
jgi:hypothetical protein